MRWVKRFRAEGLEGLKDKPGRGKKPLILPENQDEFRRSVLELQEKKIGGRIRGKDVLELMKTQYGVDPSLKTVDLFRNSQHQLQIVNTCYQVKS
jgi:transposase